MNNRENHMKYIYCLDDDAHVLRRIERNVSEQNERRKRKLQEKKNKLDEEKHWNHSWKYNKSCGNIIKGFQCTHINHIIDKRVRESYTHLIDEIVEHETKSKKKKKQSQHKMNEKSEENMKRSFDLVLYFISICAGVCEWMLLEKC